MWHGHITLRLVFLQPLANPRRHVVGHFRKKVVFNMVAESEMQAVQHRMAAQAHRVIQRVIGGGLWAQEVIGEDIALTQRVGHHERNQHRKQRERARNHSQRHPAPQAQKHLRDGLSAFKPLELLAAFRLNPKHQLGVERERISQEQIAVPGTRTRSQLVKLLLARVGLVTAQCTEAVRIRITGIGVTVMHHIVPLAPELRRHQQRPKPQPAKHILPAPAHAQSTMQHLMGQQRLATNGVPHQQRQPQIGVPRQTCHQDDGQTTPDNGLQGQKPDHPPRLRLERVSGKFLFHAIPEFPFVRLSENRTHTCFGFHCCVHL